LLLAGAAAAQSISAGTVNGAVTDPSGAAIAGATVTLHNPVTNFQQTAMTDQTGSFKFTNVPFNSYHMEVKAEGFATAVKDVPVRSTVPVALSFPLVLAGAQTTIQVEATGADLLENIPIEHNDVDENQLSMLPLSSSAAGLSQAIVLTTPGVVADSNGFFHPQGDHAQTSYMIDGQPINDQQSVAFSTQMPENAFQSLELITGSPAAQYGDKTSLVVDAVTKSGLGKKFFGDVETSYGSFGNLNEQTSFGFGSAKFGDFVVINADRSGRFLDTPEFYPMHDIGNNETFFDRIDYQPGAHDSLHLNLFAARNWFQIPNTYDQANQDQRQKVYSFNVAPGYQHTYGASTLLTINPWVRRDFVNYYPSDNPFADLPATISQDRHLLNYGLRADVSISKGKHNLKIGTELKQTRLFEDFGLGVTDFTYNPVCLNAAGDAAGSTTLTNPANCAAAGLTANPQLMPGLVPYDLTRGGSLFHFRARGNVNEYAVYAQDSITLGNWTLNGGLRFDQYNGPAEANAIEPRVGGSYQVKATGTVLRLSYARTFETPYNENLLLSSYVGQGGLANNLFGAYGQSALRPGTRNQYNTGFQQALGRYMLLDAGYFWKFTQTAYDFDVIFNTPITFPISWRQSKLDGVSGRVSTTDLKGFQAYLTLGHTRARFFGPETGGLIFNSPLDTGVFRIDHDQAYEQTVNLRYQKKKDAPWVDFTWRFDSGEVAGNVPDLPSALALDGDEQAAIGFYCGSLVATLNNPITSCPSGNYGASRVVIPKAGTFNPDTNPPRIAPHSTFDISAGIDNLLHTEPGKMSLRVSVVNIANEVALYNFLSTFSGTHFMSPRALSLTVGYSF
jgi:hypothetical protein